MVLTADDLYGRLTELDSDDEAPFTLVSGTTKSDVQAWYDRIDVKQIESSVGSRIDRKSVTDLTAPQGIGTDNLSVSDVIKSRNDDPADFDAAYVLRSDRTVVQYFKPEIGGKEPIPASDVDAYLSKHAERIVSRAVNAELLSRAKTEFGS